MRSLVHFICLSMATAAVIHAEEPDSTRLAGPYLGQDPPDDIPVLFAPGIVSTGKEHSAAMFTPDGNEVWFGRMFPQKIYYIRRIEDRWTDIQVAPFCDTSNYLYPVLTQDGRRLFFSTDRPGNAQDRPLSRGKLDLWMVERDGGQWSDPTHLDSTINYGRRTSCGSASANGDLYFSVHDGQPPDMYRSEVGKGAYGRPQRLTEINSSAPDFSPFIATDGSYLIFSSFRGGLGRSDLFISFRSSNGSWSEPKNMGPKINSAYKDEFPYVTPDGKYLFFNSNRPSSLNSAPIADGPGNIYWLSTSIIEELRESASHGRHEE